MRSALNCLSWCAAISAIPLIGTQKHLPPPSVNTLSRIQADSITKTLRHGLPIRIPHETWSPLRHSNTKATPIDAADFLTQGSARLTNQEVLAVDGDWGGDELSLLSVLLAHANLPVLMVSSVAGNAGCKQISNNMLTMLSWLNAFELPAYACFEEAQARDGAHGDNGLGGVSLPEPKFSAQPLPAVPGMIKLLSEQPDNSVILFATGPLSNIAKVLKAKPELASTIKTLIVMGGSLKDMPAPKNPRRGNITPHAEFNFFSDASAAAFVIATLKNKITLFPMDCTHQLTFTAEREQQLQSSNLSDEAKQKLTELFNVPQKMDREKFGVSPILHDVHVGLYHVFPELYQVESDLVCITLEGPMQGRTDRCEDGHPVNVGVKLMDPEAAFDKIISSFEKNLVS